MRRRRGVTLLEMMIAFSLFSVVGLVLAVTFSKTGSIWRRVSGSHDIQSRIKKAQARIASDLKSTSFESIVAGPGRTALGPEDGSFFTMLSAIDPATGQFMRTSTGTPFWQCNILYYITIPENHEALFGMTCGGSADGNGYDIGCPHKVLIRKVIDTGVATDPADESTIEEPLTGIRAASYLTRPDQFDASAMMTETGLREVAIVTTNLLTMTAELAPNAQWPGEVRVRLASVDIVTAERDTIIGQTAFEENSRYRSDILLQFFPPLP